MRFKLVFISSRTTTSLKSTKTPSADLTTPTTYEWASVRSVWTVTPWSCPSTPTVSPVWRYCLSDGTVEEAENFTVAPLLLTEQFPTTQRWGGNTVSFWIFGALVLWLMFLLQQTYKQLVTLSGRNETIHWTEGVELKELFYSSSVLLVWWSIQAKIWKLHMRVVKSHKFSTCFKLTSMSDHA